MTDIDEEDDETYERHLRAANRATVVELDVDTDGAPLWLARNAAGEQVGLGVLEEGATPAMALRAALDIGVDVDLSAF